MATTRSRAWVAMALLLGLSGLVAAQDAPVVTAAPPCPAVLLAERSPGLPARSAALLMSGQQGGSLVFSVLALPWGIAPNGLRLAFAIDVDGTSLVAGGSGKTLELDLAAYAMTTTGSISASLTQRVSIDLGTCGESLARGGVRLVGELEVPNAEHALRVLVREAGSGAFGVGELPRAVPLGAEGGALLAPPLASEAGVWLVVVEAGKADSARMLLTPEGLAAGQTISTRPLVTPRQSLKLLLPGRGLQAGLRTVGVRLLDADGKPVRSQEVALGERRARALGELDLWSFEVPIGDLDPALHFLEVTAPGALPGVSVTATLPFVVVAADRLPAPAVWTGLDGSGEPEAASQAESQRAAYLAGRGSKSEESPKLKAGYRAALSKLTGGDIAAVQQAVAELEQGSLTTGSARELEGVLAAELSVARDLAGQRKDCFPALVLLHMRLYDQYVKGRAFIPQAHARRLVEELIVRWAESSKDKSVRAPAAEALASLAAKLQDAGLDSSAARLFKRAIEVDPTSPPALLGMAAGLERSGAYRLAMRYLDQLVDAHPDHPEGRLRLAVNCGRMGSAARAEKLLRSCLESSGPAWVRVVAAQELVRLEIGNGKPGHALGLLGSAALKGIEDEQLQILHALVLDRLNRPREAGEVTRRLAVVSARASAPSPRLRYGQWPHEDLDAARQRFDEMAPAAWERLKDAIRAAKWEGEA